MGLLEALIGGAAGFVTGGPVGAGLGLLSGAVSRNTASGGGAAARTALSGSGQDLANYLRRQAYLQGVRSVLGQSMGGARGAAGSWAQASALANRPGVATTRRDQQRGGAGYPNASGASGPGLQADNTQLLREYLAGGLAGVGGVQGAISGQYALGRDAIQQQAQQGRAGLQTALAQRGMLRSGALATGLADVERARLSALAQLMGQISQQRVASAQAAQQQSASIMAGSMGQQQTIAAQQPTFADYLAELAGAYAQSRYRPEPFDYGKLAAALNVQAQPTAATPISPAQPTGSRSPYPPGYGPWYREGVS